MHVLPFAYLVTQPIIAAEAQYRQSLQATIPDTRPPP